jgi:hypothetical protein
MEIVYLLGLVIALASAGLSYILDEKATSEKSVDQATVCDLAEARRYLDCYPQDFVFPEVPILALSGDIPNVKENPEVKDRQAL